MSAAARIHRVSRYHATAPHTIALLGLLFALISSALVAAEESPSRDAFPHDDFIIREALVPMRDGVKAVHTDSSPQRKNTGDLPVILKRTPYDASDALSGRMSSHLDVNLGTEFLGDDYIYVVQDIRGRFKSEGDYFMYRAPRGAFNKTDTDETTDAWDTVDWIVKNVASNGRVGIWGNSYPGWLTLAAMRDPHPALAAAIPLNPVVDVWKADDWFHWGAFRAGYAFDFIYSMETNPGEYAQYPYDTPDMYTWMLGQGAAENMDRARTLMTDTKCGNGLLIIRATVRIGVMSLQINGLMDRRDSCQHCTCTAFGIKRISTVRQQFMPPSKNTILTMTRTSLSLGHGATASTMATGAILAVLHSIRTPPSATGKMY